MTRGTTAYARPQLVEFGDATVLTLGNGGPLPDYVLHSNMTVTTTTSSCTITNPTGSNGTNTGCLIIS